METDTIFGIVLQSQVVCESPSARSVSELIYRPRAIPYGSLTAFLSLGHGKFST